MMRQRKTRKIAAQLLVIDSRTAAQRRHRTLYRQHKHTPVKRSTTTRQQYDGLCLHALETTSRSDPSPSSGVNGPDACISTKQIETKRNTKRTGVVARFDVHVDVVRARHAFTARQRCATNTQTRQQSMPRPTNIIRTTTYCAR